MPELGIWPETLDRWIAGETSYSPEGAESYDDLQRRLLPIWQRLTEEHKNRRIVIVCHGIVCRVLLLSLLQMHPRDWTQLGRIHNVSISELVLNENTWQATRLVEVPDTVKTLMAKGNR